jgi:sterol desaturase/sphingolipid hydroxylase (fatty acid hydroxylase superfamily)
MTTPSSTASSWLRNSIRYGYFPLMAFGINGLAIWVIFSTTNPITLASQFAGLMIVALFLSFSTERILPYNKAWNQSHGDTGRDLMHFIVNQCMSLVPLLIVPIFIMTTPKPESPLWPNEWPILLQALLCLLIFDLGNNLLHWLSHTWKPMWQLHAVHHEVKRMYGLNGILKHPLYQVIASIVCTGPLVLLGMPKEYSLVLVFMSFTQLLLQHSNTDYVLGPLRRVFAVAEVHRFHHLRGVAGDVNFSLFFSFYDHLFGNAYHEMRTLSSDDIGLNYKGYPKSWWGQMKAPFKKFGKQKGDEDSLSVVDIS